MGRKSKEETRRQEILESCYQVVARRGLEGATLKSIGEEMGVAPSLLMHYFAGKEDLIRALVEHMVRRMHAAFLQATDRVRTAREKLEAYIDKNLGFEIPQSVDDKVFYGAFYLALSDERIRDSFREMYRHDRRVIVGLIREYAEEEGIECPDPDVPAVQIISVIEGFYLYRVIHGDSPELTRAAEMMKRALWRALDGS